MTRRKPKQPTDLISAQEIACFAYCPEQWRLQYGLGQFEQIRATQLRVRRKGLQWTTLPRVRPETPHEGRDARWSKE